LSSIREPMCAKCGEPNTPSRLCSKCRQYTLNIEVIRSVAIFQGTLRNAIHRFKYERLASLAAPFGDLLTDAWRANDFQADWIVPVPLHPARERDRGYNQAALLAQQLSDRTHIPTLPRALKRTRVTAVQMELKAAERRTNVAGAFACSEARVRGQRVVVIDDVCTTGATLEACAQALSQAGAASVFALTLARTP
jgi:ComF family protein